MAIPRYQSYDPSFVNSQQISYEFNPSSDSLLSLVFPSCTDQKIADYVSTIFFTLLGSGFILGIPGGIIAFCLNKNNNYTIAGCILGFGVLCGVILLCIIVYDKFIKKQETWKFTS